jgi:2-haloacid dehalogenase
MPASAPLDVRVLAFDVFGTVVDWRGGIGRELAAIARERGLVIDPGAAADAWRRRYQPFLDRVRRGEQAWQVLDDLHRAALEEVIIEFSLQELTAGDRRRLVLTWHRLPPWPDAIAGLTRLRADYILTTLSNGGMALLVNLVRSAALPFDCILSTELIKSYKPDPRAYQLVPSLLAIRPEQAMMVASHPYDLAAAAQQGMRTAFVRRPLEEWEWQGRRPRLSGRYHGRRFSRIGFSTGNGPVASRSLAPVIGSSGHR